MVDAGALGSGVSDVLGSFNVQGLTTQIIWIAISICVTIFGAIFAFWGYKTLKFRQPTIIVKTSGSEKIVFQSTLAGQFKKNKMFFGLIDWSGETEWIVKAGGRKIQDASGDDMHIINGKLGFIVEEKPDDPAVLVPIDRSKIENHNLLMNIAPSTYRGISNELRKKGERELMNPMLQYLPFISIIITGFIVLFIFLLTFNFVTGTLHDLATQCGKGAVNTVVATAGSAP